MAFTVTHSLGSASRDYSTIQTWHDGGPSDLTAAIKYGASAFSGALTLGETLTGGTSGATGKMIGTDGSSYVVIGSITGTFSNGETVTGGTSGKTFVLSTTGSVTGIIWRGEMYNDSQFTDANVGMTGHTTSSTCFPQLTAASGQSFQDAAGVRTNALKYNQSNGVGISISNNYHSIFSGLENYTQFSRLQMQQTGNANVIANGSGMVHGSMKDCIIVQSGASANPPISFGNGDVKVINTLIILNTSTAADGIDIGTNYGGTCLVVGCTIVRPSDKTVGGTGIKTGAAGNGHSVESCAVFGFSTPLSTTGVSVNKNNATDQAAFGSSGSSNQVSVTYSSVTPFTDAASTAMDFRAIAATSLAANGFLDSTDAPNDISGTARAATPTIGVWELASTSKTVVGIAVQGQAALLTKQTATTKIATQAATASQTKQTSTTKIATQAETPTLLKQVGKFLDIGQAQTARMTVTHVVLKILIAVQAQVASLVVTKVLLRTFIAVQGQAALLTKQAGKFLDAGQAQAASLAKQIGATRIAVQSTTATLVKQVGKSLITTQAQAATVAIGRALQRTFIAVQSQVASLVFTRVILRTLIAVQSQVASLTITKALTRTLIAAQASAASLVKQIQATRAASQAQTASTTKAIAITRIAAQASQASIGKFIGKIFAAVQNTVAVLKTFLPGAATPRAVNCLCSYDTTKSLSAQLGNTLNLGASE